MKQPSPSSVLSGTPDVAALSVPTPRLCISAVSGGGGKTLLSLGLGRCWRKACLRVQPFKKGPDYIDAAWLTQATGRPACNLDPFFLSAEKLRLLFAERTGHGFPAGEPDPATPAAQLPADVALLEGNRGLFDGMDVQGSCSTAELARMLACPVLLSLNCTKMTRTAAAVVAGLAHFEPGLRFAGVILGQTASSRHEDILRRTIETYTDIPVLGSLPRQRRNPLPERHMGLATLSGDAFSPETETLLDQLAELVRAHVDVDAVLDAARRAPALEIPLPPDCASAGETLYAAPRTEGLPASDDGHFASRETFSAGHATTTRTSAPIEDSARPRIGYVHDAAFWFYYPENLEALRRAGAELFPVSLLAAADWPELDGLYLGGGFPEDFAGQLADSPAVRRLPQLVAQGLPVYAECGGFMVLAEAIERDGIRYAMSGVFPVCAQFCPRPQGLGYVEARVTAENPYFPLGSRLRGHEFHYSRCIGGDTAALPPASALMLDKGTGMGQSRDGLVRGNVWASYLHIFAPAVPQWAPRFTALAAAYRRERENA